MEPIRYQPGEAVRWLTLGAEDLRGSAEKQGKSVWSRSGERSIGKDLRQTAGAIADLGKSAVAEFLHQQAEAGEYVLYEDRFEIISGNNVKTVKYAEILSIRSSVDRAVLVLERGVLEIKPFAHVVSGKIRVPIGWRRNGIEVPYGLLLDELSARAGKKIEAE